jgi:hypothetical protein
MKYIFDKEDRNPLKNKCLGDVIKNLNRKN